MVDTGDSKSPEATPHESSSLSFGTNPSAPKKKPAPGRFFLSGNRGLSPVVYSDGEASSSPPNGHILPTRLPRPANGLPMLKPVVWKS